MASSLAVGGQIPNGLAIPLAEAGVNIMGTSAEMIDNAEDRNKLLAMIDKIGVQQPRWKYLTSTESALDFAANVGYPGEFSLFFLSFLSSPRKPPPRAGSFE